jgi:AcrR family transcriptional regulator
MPASTQHRILDAACKLFYEKGYSRVSVDMIADIAGVTKRTLYNHFDSKDAVVGAALNRQSGLDLHQMQEWNLERASTSADVAGLLFEALLQWVGQARWTGSGYTRLSMELADLPGHPAREAASRHKAEVEAALATHLRRVGADKPCELARSLLMLAEGGSVLALIHRDPKYVAAAAKLAQQLSAA